MPRGGRRQGQPGVAYANRTDLLQNRNNAGSAAAGGFTAPAQPQQQVAAQVAYPEDSPNLLDPTGRPAEPVTAGLPTGDGAGPEALNLDPRLQETQALKRWLPVLEPLANAPDTPESVRTLVRYIRGV